MPRHFMQVTEIIWGLGWCYLPSEKIHFCYNKQLESLIILEIFNLINDMAGSKLDFIL